MATSTPVGQMARRWWVVALVALLAAGGAFLAVRNTKAAYTASVDITVPSDQSATSGANGQYVENFSVGLTSAAVLAEVSRRTHTPTADLSSGLSASELGNSSFIQVSYVSPDATKSKTVAIAATRATAALLERPAIQASTTLLTSAQQAQSGAQKRVDAAQKALDSFTAGFGQVDPNVLYQAAQSSLTQLNVSKQQAIAQGRFTSNFDDAIALASKQLAKLTPQIAKYNRLSRALTQAELAGQTAQARVVSGSEQLAATQAKPLIGAATVTTETARSAILKAVLIAAGIGLVLGLALVLLLGVVLANRGRTRAAHAAADKRAADKATADKASGTLGESAGTENPTKPATSAYPGQPQEVG